MIFGIGTDIVEVDRIRKFCDKFEDKFLNRILLPTEQVYCLNYTDSAPYIAVRFAAKEAIAKAFGIGIGKKLGWHDIEIIREETGKPNVRLHGKAKFLMGKMGSEKIQISLSHTDKYATATAIIEAQSSSN